MIFFNSKRLADRLRNDELTPKEFTYYFVAWSVLITVFTSALFYEAEKFLVIALVELLILIGITVWGTLKCFSLCKDRPTDFINRFIALSLPVSVRLSVQFGLVLILLLGGLYYLNGEDPRQERLFEAFAAVLFIAVYYLKMAKWFSYISREDVVD